MGEFELQRITRSDGVIERFGASDKLGGALTERFVERGQKAASLLLVTLTETPYTPVVDGQEFGVEVSNTYQGFGDETGGTSPDTVEEAAAALAEFMSADIPGLDKIKYETHKTKYGKLLKELAPGRKDPSNLRKAFEEAFVEDSRRRGIQLKDPNQGLTIIRKAPERLFGLRLTSYKGTYGETEAHDMVTVNGRVVKILADRKYASSQGYYFLSTNLNNRGGRAPKPTEVHDIGRRVVALRTNSSGR